MAGSNFRNRSVDLHNFAMIPKAEIPRSQFRMQHVHKTSFDGGYLVPMYVDEMLPGDTFNMRMTAFIRLATPLFPTLDNLHADVFFFFTPCRLVWDNFVRMMGERKPDPDSSIDFTVPFVQSDGGGFATGSLYDYLGCPTVNQVDPAENVEVNVLPFRAYNLIYNEWFRDQNLQDSVYQETGDGPDPFASYLLLKRGKKHDYFTGCLPFAQKGDAVGIPLGGTAPIVSTGQLITFNNDANTRTGGLNMTSGTNVPTWSNADVAATSNVTFGIDGTLVGSLEANLAAATGATVNALRLSFQTQKLLERDARGGTRYTELIRSHFGVISPDARLQRPEYIGGGSSTLVINPIAQTSSTSIDGSDTPQGNLAAVGTGLLQSGFTYSATEHGYVLGIVNVRADITYQQGMRKLWSRRTRYDFFWPVFSALGEQAVLNKEIYSSGVNATDDAVFGYQERWAEYRYFPSYVSSLMRSTAPGTIDPWHYSERFLTPPALNASFITDKTDLVLARATAVGEEANGQQLLADFFFDCRAARPMPMYSVPGLIDHF